MSNPGGNTDDRPTGRCSDSPRELLAAAYERYADGLYRYALMILADHAAAEDAVQLAFAKLVPMGKRVQEIESCGDYLRTVVRNECWRMLDQRRRRPKHVEVVPQMPLIEPVDGTGIDEDERIRIDTALRGLPAEQREVVYLKTYQGSTFREIAGCLNVSINTVASRYRYAIEKLREQLADRSGVRDKSHES